MGMLFRPAEVTTAYLKMGLLGFQGSGKTKTATKTAIGLVNHLKKTGNAAGNKPVFFLDTETGSDWVLPDFKDAGIPIEAAKTRAFSDLVEGVKLAERDASILLVDSATHYWKELCESYCRRKAQRLKKDHYRLQLNDWGYLKGETGWGKFADLFINSSVHIILCGRAGYEFDMDVDDEGHKQLEKTGVKMKAEGEFGYEPSLLVYMEMHQEMKGKTVEKQWRTATVLKDRAGLIDGKSFSDPGFDDFWPHIQRLNIGGRQLGVDTTRNSAAMIPDDPRDNSGTHRKIVLDEIESLLTIHYAGQAAADKKRKAELIRKHFGAAWTEMESLMSLEKLRSGYDALLFELEGIHSRWYQPPANSAAVDSSKPIDELPGDLAPPAMSAGETVYGANGNPVTTADPPLQTHAAMMAESKKPLPASIAAKPVLDHTDVNGVPAFLRVSASDEIDEKAWLEGLTRAFNKVETVPDLTREYAALVKPQRGRVSAETFGRAERIAKDAAARIAFALVA